MHGFSSRIGFCEVRWFEANRLEVIIPRIATSVFTVHVSIWALCVAEETRLGQPTLGRFAIIERSAKHAVKGEVSTG